MRTKTTDIVLTVILFSAMLISGCSCASEKKVNATEEGVVAADTSFQDCPAKPVTLTMTFVGDVMMGTNVPGNYITPDRGRSLFKDCDSITRASDLAIANLEGTCYDGTDGEQRKMTNPNTYFIFRMPGDHAARLSDAGFDAVNMANNHSFDFGMTGRRNTLRTMKSVGIEVAGLRELAEGVILERKGKKIAYIGFAASCTKVLDMLDKAEVDSMVTKYRKLADILVVSFHGGAEGTAYQHVPRKTEYYVGEERGNVYEFAHHCIDLGADIVIGHGPHVPRGMEVYKGHLIAYSLGNFCTPYRMGVRGVTAYAPLLEVTLDAEDGTLKCGHIHSFLQREGVGPRKDDNNAAAKNIRQLTLEDFPSTPLIISPEGDLTVKQ
ncbi:MAG: CapA family protein [Bacteroidaceae bacterium]|nr:CapA family protein [Bacteroidaceae bacterium]